jgi:hypothetical protein
LWFDQHLQDTFEWPATPETQLVLRNKGGVPTFMVKPDPSKPLLSVDVYYTQHGKPDEQPQDREDTKHRFWHHADATMANDRWTAKLPIASTTQPLWVYANVRYALDAPVEGAGYYYGTYSAQAFNLSSRLHQVSPEELADAGVQATLQPSLLIESFEEGWEKEWFSYNPDQWPRATHKFNHQAYKPPEGAVLGLEVLVEQANTLVILLDAMAAQVPLSATGDWQEVVLRPQDFQNLDGESLEDFDQFRQLKLSAAERLKPKRGSKRASQIVGRKWQGAHPRFRNLRWVLPTFESESKQ